MFVAAIIPAAGSGRRFGERKQFKALNGKPLLNYSIEEFLKVPEVKEIITVVPRNQIKEVRKSLIPLFNDEKTLKVVEGGLTRQDSVGNALNSIGKDIDIVCVHDAARPFVTAHLILKTIDQCQFSDGGIAAIQSVDTVKMISNGRVKSTLNRENIWLAQTPQSFQKDKFISAFKKALAKGLSATDESMLMEEAGFSVTPVYGSSLNFKVTAPQDWEQARRLVK
jgi:2-C-methyl-D-erythritol 4-phosphate cytidylyltransferase